MAETMVIGIRIKHKHNNLLPPDKKTIMSVTPLIPHDSGNFDQICQQYHWQVPDNFNIGYSICDRHDQLADTVAMFYEHEDGRTAQYTFGQLKAFSNQLANTFGAMGIERGDRVAMVLPQRVETGITHIAAYKYGAIAVPLSGLFGTDALAYRLKDSGAKVVVTDQKHVEIIESLRDDLPELEIVINTDDEGTQGFWPLLGKARNSFDIPLNNSDDAALLIYTSGTTGPPKGASIAHRCFYGNLTGFEMSQNFYPQDDDLFWTPADWAWTGGLIDALLATWYYGKPILGYEGGRFDPEKVCQLLEKYQVRNGFIPPTALKMLRQIPDLKERYNIRFRSIMSAGETMGAELYHWGKETFGVEINEMWGQTEFNYLAGNCSAIMPVKAGSMGKAYPGHRVEAIDEDGNVLPAGEVGELAAYRHDPVVFLGYWNRPGAAEEKFIGDWWRTGDTGYKDEDGYIWFLGRNDDVISTAGHRVGPGEIEDILLKHPAVLQAAVIGKPDELRGEIIKAFVVRKPDIELSPELEDDIKQHVKSRLAAHEYPREIEFIDELPLTTTGKVRRVELRKRETAK